MRAFASISPCLLSVLAFALGCSGGGADEGEFLDSGMAPAVAGEGASTGSGGLVAGAGSGGGLEGVGGASAGSGGAGAAAGGNSASGGAAMTGTGGLLAGAGGVPGAGGEGGAGPNSSGGSGEETAVGGSSGDGGASSSGGAEGSGGASALSECPYSGNVEYVLNEPESWPEDVETLLTAAMDEAVYYYNCYSDLSHSLTVNYKEGVPTAEANVDGWMSFGSDRGYMVVATAMHEVGHTMGVGFSPWEELIEDGRWIGPTVVELISNLPAEERDPDQYSQRDYITADGQHFWPYGMNQATEHQSEWSLINHVRLVAAMQEDKQLFRDQ